MGISLPQNGPLGTRELAALESGSRSRNSSRALLWATQPGDATGHKALSETLDIAWPHPQLQPSRHGMESHPHRDGGRHGFSSSRLTRRPSPPVGSRYSSTPNSTRRASRLARSGDQGSQIAHSHLASAPRPASDDRSRALCERRRESAGFWSSGSGSLSPEAALVTVSGSIRPMASFRGTGPAAFPRRVTHHG